MEAGVNCYNYKESCCWCKFETSDWNQYLTHVRKALCEDQLYFYPTRKALKEGVHSTLNHPVKSIASPPTVATSAVAVAKRELHNLDNGLSSPPVVYPDFTNFKQRIFKLKLPESWGVVITDSLVTVSCLSPEYVLPKFEIFEDSSLRFTVRVYGWLLMDDHDLYKKLCWRTWSICFMSRTWKIDCEIWKHL